MSRRISALHLARFALPHSPARVRLSASLSAARAKPSPQQAHKARPPPKGPWWWLEESHVRDAAMRRPDDPEYDASTVYIPQEAASSMTDFQKQATPLLTRQPCFGGA